MKKLSRFLEEKQKAVDDILNVPSDSDDSSSNDENKTSGLMLSNPMDEINCSSRFSHGKKNLETYVSTSSDSELEPTLQTTKLIMENKNNKKISGYENDDEYNLDTEFGGIMAKAEDDCLKRNIPIVSFDVGANEFEEIEKQFIVEKVKEYGCKWDRILSEGKYIFQLNRKVEDIHGIYWTELYKEFLVYITIFNNFQEVHNFQLPPDCTFQKLLALYATVLDEEYNSIIFIHGSTEQIVDSAEVVSTFMSNNCLKLWSWCSND